MNIQLKVVTCPTHTYIHINSYETLVAPLQSSGGYVGRVAIFS